MSVAAETLSNVESRGDHTVLAAHTHTLYTLPRI